ncbi:MAG: UvrD-helicase domain-containing protein, partial [Elusimicrobiaceae bacterium]|nr:UvrD-helicase domain-containing protein [Elusimicrobiaceae bacterium]
MIQEDRTALQTSLGVNVVVEAGAGTGKTTLLINRLCLCVLAQDTPVERLVALTFTEKAAAEIKTRFIFKLQQIVQAVRNATEDRTLHLLRSYFKVKEEDIIARAEKALARLDRASIGTIHGFCAEILKTFPLEAALAPNVQIDEGTQGRNLFETRWNRFLDEELGPNAARKEQWKTVLAEISLDELESFSWELCSGKIENYDYYEHADLLLSMLREKQQQATELARKFLKNAAKPRAIEKALLWTAASLQRISLFLQKKEVPLEENSAPISKPTRPKDWEEETFEEALSLYQFAQKITPEKQKVFLLAYQLVLPVCEKVRQDYREAGLVSFDDLIIKTRNLLRENLYVRRLLKEKFEAIFVDEFQDTDPVQGELLLFLSEEKPGTAARWQDVHLLPGKLFIVGDPKQSIYRFRGADITAYELFTDLILRQGGKKFFLQKNFRSTPEIIETANSVCSRA